MLENLPDFINNPFKIGTIKEWKSLIKYLTDLLFHEHHEIRCEYVRNIGFPIITIELIDELVKFISNKSVVDIGARTGFLSYILANRGVNITAIDTLIRKYMGESETPKWYTINQKDAIEENLDQYEILILSWPDHDTYFGYKIIKKMNPGQIIIYQGESWDGCTADDQFHRMLYSDEFEELQEICLKLDELHLQFPGIHDYWQIYMKR
jgi:hypothetical protein